MNNYKDIELIQNFRSDLLNELELLSFNERLSKDAAFKELYDDFFESEKLLKLKDLWAVKEELNKYDYAIDEENGGTRGTWLLGISVLVLLTSGGVYWMSGNSAEKKNAFVASSVHSIESKEEGDVTAYNKVQEKEKYSVIHNPGSVSSSIDVPIINSTMADSVLLQVGAINDLETSEESISSAEAKNCNESPKVDFLTKGTCVDENNGVVIIKNIKGSYSPYKIIKDSSEVFSGKGEFKGLKHGKHLFYVLDNRNCKISLPVIVEKIDCIKEVTASAPAIQNYLIYIPGQSWKVPMLGKKGSIEIRDQKGSIIFSKDVLREESDEWAGTDMNSSEVEPGVYFFLLKEEGQKDKIGNITVLK